VFTWDEALVDNREMDIEFARWGDGRGPTNAQFVVQPHVHRFVQPAAAPSFHSFRWAAADVCFASNTTSNRSRPGATPVPTFQLSVRPRPD